MNRSRLITTRWRYGALVCLAMTLLSLIPQIHLWTVRGRDWNGTYVSPQGDEAFYSAYVNALIAGRTRRNDPFGAKDSIRDPLPESIFSIQFVPAYIVALPARLFGISASAAFIMLIAIAAAFASLCVFRLLDSISADSRFAMTGTLFVLCLGCIIGQHGIFGTFVDIGPAAFPFLRRYQPAVPFPLFFLFQLLVWRTLTNESGRRARLLMVLAALALAVLIFSHLYLWTAGAAWLVCMSVLWFCFRPADRRKVVELFTVVAVLALIALIPYVVMILNRAATLDEQQILIPTHRPDLLRLHEVLAAGILAVLVIGVLRRNFERRDPRVLYAVSLALVTFIVFNQQVLTGRTMQAFHFEVAVVNYTTLIALLITVTCFWKAFSSRFLVWMSGLILIFGVLVTSVPARLIFVPQAVISDRSVPVLLRLKELSGEDGTLADLRTRGQASTMVFSPSVSLIALLPTWTSQATLLDMTGVDCRGITRAERKHFFFMHLYYSNVDFEALRKALSGATDKSHDELASVRTVTFGYERTSPALTPEFEPIRPDEIEREVQNYQTYVNSFSREEALKRPLTYAIIPVAANLGFTNLDRWYERDAGERIGDYVLYRLKLKP